MSNLFVGLFYIFFCLLLAVVPALLEFFRPHTVDIHISCVLKMLPAFLPKKFYVARDARKGSKKYRANQLTPFNEGLS